MIRMEEGLTWSMPQEVDRTKVDLINISEQVFKSNQVDQESAINVVADNSNYEQFLADVWVGIVLTLMVLSCVCFMCSCLIYHKFQQWKARVLEARNPDNVEAGSSQESDLPSYTIASGLPSYEEALEQLEKVKELTKLHIKPEVDLEPAVWVPHTPPTPLNSLSVMNFLQIYKATSASSSSSSSKPS